MEPRLYQSIVRNTWEKDHCCCCRPTSKRVTCVMFCHQAAQVS